MRITELLTESQQLDEGPILNKIGAGIGKAAGTVAKGVGAVAGGIAGLGTAAKKGFQAGKTQVAQAGDEPATPTLRQAPAKTAVKNPAAPAATAPAKPGFKSAFNKAYAAGQDYAKTRDAADAAGTPLPKQGILDKATQAIKAGTAPDQPAQGQAPAKVPSQYTQIKASIDKLDPRSKKQILQFLQKSVGATATPAAKPTTAPATATPAAPADDTPINPATGKPLSDQERKAHMAAGGEFDGETGAPLPLGQKATNATPPADNFEKKVADLKAKRDAEKAAAAKTAPAAPATTPTTTAPADGDTGGVGSAAIAAAKAGQSPEAAAKAALAANNPELARLMKQSGDMPATTKPHTGGKVAGQTSMTPNAIRKRNARAAKSAAVPAESVTEGYVSIFRKV